MAAATVSYSLGRFSRPIPLHWMCWSCSQAILIPGCEVRMLIMPAMDDRRLRRDPALCLCGNLRGNVKRGKIKYGRLCLAQVPPAVHVPSTGQCLLLAAQLPIRCNH
jgi:hypothetical protein